MKIISTDNFGGDYPDERVVTDNISNAEFAKVMCEALNSRFSGDQAPMFYKVVEDGYVLQPGFEP